MNINMHTAVTRWLVISTLEEYVKRIPIKHTTTSQRYNLAKQVLFYGFLTQLQACQFGYYPSCLSSGLLDSANPYSESYERKAAPNPAKAKESYKKACDLGSVNGGQAEACHRYAAMFIKVATFFCIRIILILSL